MYENVNLWFAKNNNGEIITINEVDDSTKNTYYCPLCGSEVIPKAIKKDAKMTSHFAHIDKSKCSSESMIHWWFKHKYLLTGDKFIVKTDKEIEYECKEILVEQSYTVDENSYQPDITVVTTNNETIYFEMAYSNKKKIEEYLDMWKKLNNIVVEIDIKRLLNSVKTENKEFDALFYNGICFNYKRNTSYYKSLGKYRENILEGGIDEDKINRVKKLDWFWIDTFKYNKGELDIRDMVELIDSIEDREDRNLIMSIMKKPRCSNLNDDYWTYMSDRVSKEILNEVKMVDKNLFKIDVEFQERKANLHEKDINVIFTDIKDHCGYLVNLNRYGLKGVIKQINGMIDELLVREERKEMNEYTKDNPLFKDTVKKVLSIYKAKDSNYNIYDRFGYIQCVSVYYNGFSLCDIHMPKEIICSEDEDLIFNFLIEEIKSNLPAVVSITNEVFIYEKLNSINQNYKNLIKKEKVTKEVKINKYRKQSYNDEYLFNYEITHKKVKEDCIQFYINKNNLDGKYVTRSIANIYLEKNILYRGQFQLKNKESDDSIIKIFNSENDWLCFYEILDKEINKSIQFDIKNTKCPDCGEYLDLCTQEIEFYREKGFYLPIRCKACIKKRKTKKGDDFDRT